jgi:protein MpaA
MCLGCQNKVSQRSENVNQKPSLSKTKSKGPTIKKMPEIKSNKKSIETKKKSEKDVVAERSELSEPEHFNAPKYKQDKKRKTVKLTAALKKYCKKIDSKFKRYKWGKSGCDKVHWNHVRDSFLGTPLIWGVFGDEEKIKTASKEELNTTLVLCGVHGDEITPIKFCFDLIKHLQELDHPWAKDLVAIAPIVTPDAFFKRRPTRTNYRGVDVNRNFPTKDWKKDALRLWKGRYRKDPRRYPGKKSLSEHETVFQVNLIKRYKPSKIISVHAPLTILDYDGPGVGKGGIYLASNANKLLKKMSKSAKGYRIKNYPFFPGSLGNYAGNERGIPTYTLELPSSDYTKHKRFWKRFRESLDLAIFKNINTKTAESSLKNQSDQEPKKKTD